MRSECQERRREACQRFHLLPVQERREIPKDKTQSRAENGPGGEPTKKAVKGMNGREPRILGAGRAPNDFIALVSDSKLAVNAQQLHTYTHTEQASE